MDCAFVFHREGKPIGDFRQEWADACTAAGLGKVCVHDLRRCAIRSLVRAGVPDLVAMRISGHKTRSVFDWRNIVSEADLKGALERRDGYLVALPTKRKVAKIKR